MARRKKPYLKFHLMPRTMSKGGFYAVRNTITGKGNAFFVGWENPFTLESHEERIDEPLFEMLRIQARDNRKYYKPVKE